MAAPFHCRSCGSDRCEPVLDLGVQPLVNNFLRPEDLAKTEPKFPLRLLVCAQCWLAQLAHTVPPVEMFSEYLYFSSFSDWMVRHAREASEHYLRDYVLDNRHFVVEIASNDGYLLQNFVRAGVPCLGIEPASNIAQAARERGVETLEGFFGLVTARSVASTRRPADLILGNNVFAHAPDLNDFLAGLKALLVPGGRIVLEFPYLEELICLGEFDTIYHEHVFYFSLSALVPAFERHGLRIFDVERIPIHGGSLRLFAGHAGAHTVAERVGALLAAEDRQGMKSPLYYRSLENSVARLRRDLLELLGHLKREGRRIAAYGASAKGSVLLNHFGIGADLLEFAADRSTYKHGRLTPGKHLPIFPPEIILERQPDYLLLLAWNFADEILAQQEEYRSRGGKFIIPLPELRVV